MSSGFRSLQKFGLDIGLERLGVDRTIKHPGCLDTIVAQRANEGHGLPMSMRHMGDQPLAARTPAAQRRHVGLDPGFVDEDKAARVDPGAIMVPSPASACYVRPDLLGGQNGFF